MKVKQSLSFQEIYQKEKAAKLKLKRQLRQKKLGHLADRNLKWSGLSKS